MPRRSWWALFGLIGFFLICRAVDLGMDRSHRLAHEERTLAKFERLHEEAPRFGAFFLRAGWVPPWPEHRRRDAGELLNSYFSWTSEGVVIPWDRHHSAVVRELFNPELKRLWLDTQSDNVPLGARLQTASGWDLSSVHDQIIDVLATYDHWDPTTGVRLPADDEGVLIQPASQDLRDLPVFAALVLAKRLSEGRVPSSRDDLRHLGRLCISRGDFAGLECAARLERLIHNLELDVWDQGEVDPYDGEALWRHLSALHSLWFQALAAPTVLERLDADTSSPAFCAGLASSTVYARLWQSHYQGLGQDFVEGRLKKVAQSSCQATWLRRQQEGAPAWAPINEEAGPNFLKRRDLWFWKIFFPRWSWWKSLDEDLL